MSTAPLALFNGSYISARPTGIGVVARDLAAELNPAQIRLLLPQDPHEAAADPTAIAIPGDLSPEHGARGHWRRLCWTQNQLPTLMRQQRASLLLSPLPEAPLLRGVRSVVLAHDLLPLRYPQPGPLLAYQLAYVPLVLHQAVRVLCNSEATAREVHGWLKVPASRLVPIRLGFNPGLLRPLDLPRQPFLLVLGRHNPHKNLARVLRAFAALPNHDCHLHLVGPSDRRYTPRLQALATHLGIAERCRWSPWVSDQERLLLLNQCRALVIASLWEGFGLPALEAMACGTPVIAARAGALPEVVGSVGLLVEPQRVEEIREAMACCLGDADQLRRASVDGPQRAAGFRWSETARHVGELLEHLA